MSRLFGVHRCGLAAGLILASPALLCAQVTVTLPDTSQTTAASATVSEQAKVTLPSGVTFNVTNISANTGGNTSLTIANIVLSTATKQLKVSVQANAAAFTPPVSGATTWSATDVSWNAAAWTQGTGSSATLSSGAYGAVGTCTAGVSSCSTSALTFTLAAKSTVKRSGAHTLVVRWKIESIGV